ncbi:MAG: hypothetical protein ACI9JN_000111 [Bacteroidia bacterium]|jgi:uncharacterized protein
MLLESMNIGKLKKYLAHKFQTGIRGELSYHTWDHVLGVLNVCNQYARRYKITGREAHLLRTAALIHDIGFLWTYKDHEDEGVRFTTRELPAWGYSKKDIEAIDGMIMATQIPQKPKNLLEQIVCDADLDYLGTDQFYTIGETLFKEFIAMNQIKTRADWNKLQINFLSGHEYHTTYAKKFREPVKQKHLQDLIENS